MSTSHLHTRNQAIHMIRVVMMNLLAQHDMFKILVPEQVPTAAKKQEHKPRR
jgi:hypothetical protein